MVSTKNQFKWSDLPSFIRDCVGAAFTLAVVSVITVVLLAIGAIILRVIWPQPEFVVDESIIRFADSLAWPLVGALAIFFFISSKSLRRGAESILRRIKTMKAGDYEISFSEAGARQLKRDLEDSLKEFQDQSEVEYRRSARSHRVRECLHAYLQEILRLSRQLLLPDSDGLSLSKVSATVHVRDVVYEESLYQLVDYVPAGRGSGRRFSIRYGAIGISLRSGKDRYWNATDPAVTAESLISEWGMTSDEAGHSVKDEFALCLVLRDEHELMPGVFFLKASKLQSITKESSTAEQERVLDDFLEKLNSDANCEAKRKELANSVSSVYKDLALSGTFIRVYK